MKERLCFERELQDLNLRRGNLNSGFCRKVDAFNVDCSTPPAQRKLGRNPKGEMLLLNPISPDQRDIKLWDYDISDHRLKPVHEKALLDLLKFMADDAKQRQGGKWTVSIAGMASRKGQASFNDKLSEKRAACVERFMRTHLFDYLSGDVNSNIFSQNVDFNTCFEGFHGSPPGEKDEFRAVRVSVHRPGKVPPPIIITPCESTFKPSIHGFKFDNSFSVISPRIYSALTTPPLSTILAKLGITVGRGNFGLCGGMVTLARDYYNYKIPIPSTSSIPTPGDSLFFKLVDRQLDSLNLNTSSIGKYFGLPIIKFARWMSLPDTGRGSVSELTLTELRRVQASLMRGELKILGLVLKSKTTGSLTDNHQVLARCMTQISPNTYEIDIYDPNFHDCDNVKINVIITGSEATSTEIVPSCPSGGSFTVKIRGFFVMPYKPVKP